MSTEKKLSILIIGQGGREHALAFAFSQSASCKKLYAWPGSDGISEYAERLQVLDLNTALRLAKENNVTLCVAGEEKHLIEDEGLFAKCHTLGMACWGPPKKAALLEASKIFAKEFMFRHKIPTAKFSVANTAEEARRILREKGFPLVLKFDGLAAGKGVVVCQKKEEAEIFLHEVFEQKRFGEGRIVMEEYLEGKEVSLFCMVSGSEYKILPPARDYKRLLDNDKGPNTGGMGAVAAKDILTKEEMSHIEQKIIRPTIQGMKEEELRYTGFLYFGLILTDNGAKVLEYNCRLGDPEAQAVLPLIQGDFAGWVYSASQGDLRPRNIHISENWSTCLVCASKYYPKKASKGKKINGLNLLEKEITTYHSGTEKKEEEQYFTNGGRIFSLQTQAKTLSEAREKIYHNIKKIDFSGLHFRTDIGTLHF